MTEKKLPNGWKTVKLGDLKFLSIQKGKALSSNSLQNGTIPVIAGGRTIPYFHNQSTHDCNIITISASGAYAGYVWYHDYPIWASDCNVIYSKDENEIITKFIYFILRLKQDEIYYKQTGGAQPHIYVDDIKDLTITLPPLPIQQRIAAILSKADEEVRLHKEITKKLEERNKGLAQKLLSGEIDLTNFNL